MKNKTWKHLNLHIHSAYKSPPLHSLSLSPLSRVWYRRAPLFLVDWTGEGIDGGSAVFGFLAKCAPGAEWVVQHAFRSVPEKAMAPTHAQARAIRHSRCVSGSKTLTCMQIEFYLYELLLLFPYQFYDFSVRFVWFGLCFPWYNEILILILALFCRNFIEAGMWGQGFGFRVL